MTRKPLRITVRAVPRKRVRVAQLVQVLLLFVRNHDSTGKPLPDNKPDPGRSSD